MARLKVSVYIIKRLSSRCCCKHQWQDCDFRHMLYRSSVLIVAACNNCETTIGKTAILGRHYKEAMCSPLLYPSTARPWVSVYITKRFCARCCCMHEQWDCNFRNVSWRSSWLAIVAWINGETAFFGTCYKALYWSLLHLSTARPRFLVGIIKKLCARHCRLYEWWECKFRYVL